MTITRDDVLAAARRVGERPTQAAVARELGITRHQLIRIITPEDLRSSTGSVVPPADVSVEQMLAAAEQLAERGGFDSVTHAALGAFFGRSEKWAQLRVPMSAVHTRLRQRGFTGSRKTTAERKAQIFEAARSMGFRGLTYNALARACNCSHARVRELYPRLAELGESPQPLTREQIVEAARTVHGQGERVTSSRVAQVLGVAGSTVRYHFADMEELKALI